MPIPHVSWTRSALAVVVLAVALPGCGGGGGGADDAAGSAVLHVDATSGHDGNPGTAEAPFRSITRALQVARTALALEAGDAVQVELGLYDASVETFPLIVPSGVVLEFVGTAFRPEIFGGGAVPAPYESGRTAAVVLEDYATIRGFEVKNPLTGSDPGFHYGVFMVGNEAVVDDCSVRECMHGGIRVVAGDDILIRDTYVNGNTTGVGVHFAGGGVGGRVWHCTISYNRIGVEYDAPGAALHGEVGPKGRVQIHDNSDTDVWVAPGIFVNARGCNWDTVPPQASTTDVGGGIDIFHQDGQTGIDITDFGLIVL